MSKKEKYFNTFNSLLYAVIVVIFISFSFAAADNGISAYDLISIMNQLRTRNGYSALSIDQHIMAAAQQTADIMAAYHMTGHIGDAKNRISAAGYNNGYECWATENWTVGNPEKTLAEIQAVWSDPAHMIPATNPAYCHIGAGISTASDGTVYYVLQAAYPANKAGCGYLNKKEAEANGLKQIWDGEGYDTSTSQIIHAVETAQPNEDGYTIHTVKQGQTLYAISAAYNTTVEDLAAWNRLGDNPILYPEQKLLIPFSVENMPVPTPDLTPFPTMSADGKFRHTVSEGETIWSIAQRWHTNEKDLMAVNSLDYDTVLGIGWRLFVPVTPTPTISSTLPFAAVTKTPEPIISFTPDLDQQKPPDLKPKENVPELIPIFLIVFTLLSAVLGIIIWYQRNKNKRI